MKEKYAIWHAPQIPAGLKKGLAVDEIDVKIPLTTMKPLHAKWIMNLCDEITSKKGKEIVFKGYKVAGILDAVEMGSAKMVQIHLLGILSASRMTFNSPKKVTLMLMNNMNQSQTMNMFWMTNEIPSMPLLFRSSSIFTGSLKHLFCLTLFIKAYN